MNSCKLDVLKLNDLINDYKTFKNSYEENIKLLCNSLSNIEFAWNDLNSKKYVHKVLSDKNKIIDYLSNLDLLYNQLFYFLDSLNKITSKFGYSKSLKSLVFDNSKFKECKESFSNIRYYINVSIEIINECLIKLKFSDVTLIRNLKEQMKSFVSLLDIFISVFESYVNAMLQELDERIEIVNKLKNFDLKLEPIEYAPKTVPLKDINV